MASHTTFYPAGRLVPIFAANDGLNPAPTALALAKIAAASGETVLIVDCQDGALMEAAGIIYNKTLGDVLFRGASLIDAQYITSNEHFTAIAAGDATLDSVLGSLAALSLDYDWVFVSTASGCTPAHIRLAGAASISLLAYDTHADNFMRAYWMTEACRQRYPNFDPLLISMGQAEESIETATLLRDTIGEFLGAPPPYAGHAGTLESEKHIMQSMLHEMSQAA